MPGTSVPVGITSLIGWGVSALAIIPTIVKNVEEGKAAFFVGGPEKWLAVFSIAAFSITNIGRYAQAVVHSKGQLPTPEIPTSSSQN